MGANYKMGVRTPTVGFFNWLMNVTVSRKLIPNQSQKKSSIKFIEF